MVEACDGAQAAHAVAGEDERERVALGGRADTSGQTSIELDRPRDLRSPVRLGDLFDVGREAAARELVGEAVALEQFDRPAAHPHGAPPFVVGQREDLERAGAHGRRRYFPG